MRQTLNLFPLLCLLIGQICADGRVTLRLADQKGNMHAQLETADALDSLTYGIRQFKFPATTPLAEALNTGAMNAGIIGDAPLLFILAAGARLKAITVDKPDPYSIAVLVRGDSPLRSANGLKGQRIATGRGSIGHFIALKVLASVGLGERDVELRFLDPVSAKMALASGSVDVQATWKSYATFAETADKARALVDGHGLWASNNFLAATDSTPADPAKRAVLQDYLQRLASAQRWAYLHPDKYSRNLVRIIGFPEDATHLQSGRRRLRWQALDERTFGQQQETADFYQAHGLIPQRLDVRLTFASGLAVKQASDADIRQALPGHQLIAISYLSTVFYPNNLSVPSPAAGTPVSMGARTYPRSRRMSHPFLRRLAIALAASAVLSGVDGAHTEEVLRIGSQKSSTLLILIRNRGTFERGLIRQGIRVSWHKFPSGLPLLGSLNIGNVDLSADVAGIVPIFAQTAGARLTYFARETPSPVAQTILISEHSPLESLAGLEGKCITVTRAADSHYLLIAALASAGLEFSDAQPAYLTPADGRAAFENSKVDAWVTWDLYVASVQHQQRTRILVDGQNLASYQRYCLTSNDYARKYPEVLRQAFAELQHTGCWLKSHPADAAKILGSLQGNLNAATVEQANARRSCDVQPMNADGLDGQQRTTDAFRAQGLLPKPVDMRIVEVWQPRH